jgi:hypothetical protein
MYSTVLTVVGLQVLGLGRGGTVDLAEPSVSPSAAAADDEPAADPAAVEAGPEGLRDPSGDPSSDPSSDASADVPPGGELPQVIEQPALPAPPSRLRLPTIEVDAEVVSVGLEADGAMEIPSDVRTVGWYDPFAGSGLSPGEPGTAVIAGHVDSRVQGRGAFWLLRDLQTGDMVEVEHSDGTTSTWRIESVIRYPKTDIPIEDIFTFEGPSRLALITCGGEFDRSSGSYLDNYVVTAVPAMRVPGGELDAPSSLLSLG